MPLIERAVISAWYGNRDSASNFLQTVKGIQASVLMLCQWPREVTSMSEERLS